MRLRGKLVLLVGVPVAGAVVLSTLVLAGAWRDAQQATALGSLEHLASLTERTTILMRALQDERTTATDPAGRRDQVVAGRRLSDRTVVTDAALGAFREAIRGLDRAGLTSGIEHAVEAAEAQLATLPNLRNESGASTSRGTDRALAAYDGIAEALIAVVVGLRGISTDHEINGYLATLVSFLRVNEQQTRLDAVLGLAFSAGEFPPGLFRRLVTITAEANVQAANLTVDSDERTNADFERILTSGPGRETSTIATAALGAVYEVPKVDPNHWHDQQGRRIAMARQLGDRLIARIAARTAEKRTEWRRMLLLVLIVAGLAVPGSLALAWTVARGLHRSLSSLHAAANRVRAERDFGVRIVATSADEIGQLGDAWNEMMTGIQTRDRELHDHRARLEETIAERTADLMSERQRLALILTSAGEGIVGLDQNACLTFLNPAAELLLGLTADATVGRPFHDVVQHEMDGSPCTIERCPIPRTLTNGSLGSFTDHRIAKNPGGRLTIDGSSTAILDEGRITGAVLSLRDVTAQKNLEFQLQQARKLEAIGTLAAGIAHEINTPMQFIGDNVSFLQEAVRDMGAVLQGYRSAVQEHEGLASDVRQSLEQLESDKDLAYVIEHAPRSCESALAGVARVSKIVCAMKEFSHSGGEDKAPADLNRAIESTATVATSVWKHVAELDLRLAPDLPAASVHLGEINQVILNLIVNAAHAIGDATEHGGKGRITLSTHHDDTHVEIRVADTGTGIPESARDRIFNPFFTTKAVGKGTGQGLALARSVVTDRHGGSISFETEMGRGTTFIIRLPFHEPALPVAQVA